MNKLISVNFESDFGFFRKPDANNTINLSYNMLHKPALLGILGAIVGLKGYSEKGKLPEYYEVLKKLKIGIAPLKHDKGNFQKTVIKYSNTIGYANNGSNFLTEEATLIKPSYKVYLLLDLENEHHLRLYHYIKDGQTEFIPYFGKNEFQVWWDIDTFQEYEFLEAPEITNSIKLKTLFEKNEKVKGHKENMFDLFSFQNTEPPYMYFERLPKYFNEDLFQYELGEFAYTTFSLNKDYKIENLYLLKKENEYVQLQ